MCYTLLLRSSFSLKHHRAKAHKDVCTEDYLKRCSSGEDFDYPAFSQQAACPLCPPGSSSEPRFDGLWELKTHMDRAHFTGGRRRRVPFFLGHAAGYFGAERCNRCQLAVPTRFAEIHKSQCRKDKGNLSRFAEKRQARRIIYFLRRTSDVKRPQVKREKVEEKIFFLVVRVDLRSA